MNIYKLYIPLLTIAFVQAAATASIATVEAIFLRYQLGASYTMIGSVLGAAAVGYLLFAPFLKQLPDRIGRSQYLVWTSFMLAVAAIFAANITQPAMYLVSKTFIVLLAPLTFGILLKYIEEELKYNANTDKCYVGITIATMLGGITGFLLAGNLAASSYSHAYVLSTFAFSIVGFISLQLPNTTQHIKERTEFGVLKRLETAFSSKHRTITWIVLATNGYWALRDITIPLLIIEMGYGPEVIGGLFAIGAFMGLLSSIITRNLLMKNHPERVMVSALGVATIASLILPFGGLIVLGVLYAIYVGSEVSLTPAISDRIEETAAYEKAHPYLTSLSTASALAWSITPWVVGILLESGFSLRITLFLGGLLLAAAYNMARIEYSPTEYFPKLAWKKNKKGLTW